MDVVPVIFLKAMTIEFNFFFWKDKLLLIFKLYFSRFDPFLSVKLGVKVTLPITRITPDNVRKLPHHFCCILSETGRRHSAATRDTLEIEKTQFSGRPTDAEVPLAPPCSAHKCPRGCRRPRGFHAVPGLQPGLAGPDILVSEPPLPAAGVYSGRALPGRR